MAGPFLYLYPGLGRGKLYNLAMCVILLTAAYGIRQGMRGIKQYIVMIPAATKRLIAFIEVITVIPILVIYPLFETQEQLLMVTSLLLVYAVFIMALIVKTLNVVIRNRELTLRKDNAEVQKKLIEQSYGKLSHFTEPAFRLLRESIDAGDINEIRSVYAACIEPVYSRHIKQSQLELLDLIAMKSIRACVYDVMLRVPHLELSISGRFQVSESVISESDLYIILAEYFNNAINHMEGRADGVIYVLIMQNEDGSFIEISNTYCGDTESFSVRDLYRNRNENGHMGFGLRYTKELLDKSDIIYNTYLRDQMFVQYIEL